jgi:hypothetical protein
MITPDEATKLLGIYLEDHVAAATAGCRRARRLAEAEAGSADASALTTLADDIEADFDALLAMVEQMGFEPSRLKSAVAAMGEKLGALKPNGHLLERSPLSTVIELEALQMAVRGKRALWETLQITTTPPTAIDLDGLVARADAQMRVLTELHAARVATTFASSTRPARA